MILNSSIVWIRTVNQLIECVHHFYFEGNSWSSTKTQAAIYRNTGCCWNLPSFVELPEGKFSLRAFEFM